NRNRGERRERRPPREPSKQSGRRGPYRQASPPPARHRPGARPARRQRCHSIRPQAEGEFTMRLMKKSLLRVEALEDRSLPSAAFVLDWNDLVVDVQRLRNQGNQQAARALAMMGVAVYDSVNAINPTHEVYHVPAT